MREFIAETQVEPRLRAWLYPADEAEDAEDPFEPRPTGWRIVIETIDEAVRFEPIRSTWEPTIQEALRHMDLYWPGKPVWRDAKTGEIVNLDP